MVGKRDCPSMHNCIPRKVKKQKRRLHHFALIKRKEAGGERFILDTQFPFRRERA